MITDSFDERTLANMDVALARACEFLRHGDEPEARRYIANKILQRARRGDRTLHGLTQVAYRAAAELSDVEAA